MTLSQRQGDGRTRAGCAPGSGSGEWTHTGLLSDLLCWPVRRTKLRRPHDQGGVGATPAPASMTPRPLSPGLSPHQPGPAPGTMPGLKGQGRTAVASTWYTARGESHTTTGGRDPLAGGAGARTCRVQGHRAIVRPQHTALTRGAGGYCCANLAAPDSACGRRQTLILTPRTKDKRRARQTTHTTTKFRPGFEVGGPEQAPEWTSSRF